MMEKISTESHERFAKGIEKSKNKDAYYPLYKYIVKDRDIFKFIEERLIKNSVIMYGFLPNTTKSDILNFLNVKFHGKISKIKLYSLNRPMAVLTFKNTSTVDEFINYTKIISTDEELTGFNNSNDEDKTEKKNIRMTDSSNKESRKDETILSKGRNLRRANIHHKIKKPLLNSPKNHSKMNGNEISQNSKFGKAEDQNISSTLNYNLTINDIDDNEENSDDVFNVCEKLIDENEQKSRNDSKNSKFANNKPQNGNSKSKNTQINILNKENNERNIFVKEELTFVKASSFAFKIPKRSKLDKSRIIIRNVSFKATEDMVYDVFKICGPIISVTFPTKVSEDGHLQRTGCCFVQFTNIIDANRSVKRLNRQQICGRRVAVDMAVSKQEYEIFLKESDSQDDRSLNSKSILSFKNDKRKASPSSEKFESFKLNNDPEEREPDENDDFNTNSNSTKGRTNKNYKNELETVSDQNSKSDNTKLHRTVFVQNISWLSTKANLNEFMQKNFGDVEDCRLVIDKEFNQPKGTAFVAFENEDSFKKCIQTNDPEQLTLDGNKLRYLPAKSRQDIEELKNNSLNKPKIDRRNMSLAKFGLFSSELDNEHIDFNLNEHELNLRLAAWKEKQMKLKDVNCFVSKNRLCVRNLPQMLDNGQFSHAYQKLIGKNGKVVRSFLIKNKFRPSQLEQNKLKNAGYGFLEFNKHEAAMSALNMSANKSAYDVFKVPESKGCGKLIVDFAVENHQKLKQRMDQLKEIKNGFKNRKRVSD